MKPLRIVQFSVPIVSKLATRNRVVGLHRFFVFEGDSCVLPKGKIRQVKPVLFTYKGWRVFVTANIDALTAVCETTDVRAGWSRIFWYDLQGWNGFVNTVQTWFETSFNPIEIRKWRTMYQSLINPAWINDETEQFSNLNQVKWHFRNNSLPK